jgi:hypothetical protein
MFPERLRKTMKKSQLVKLDSRQGSETTTSRIQLQTVAAKISDLSESFVSKTSVKKDKYFPYIHLHSKYFIEKAYFKINKNYDIDHFKAGFLLNIKYFSAPAWQK